MSMSIKTFRRKIWSVTRGLTEFETEILKCIARSGPLNINQTRREVRHAYSSTRKAIFNLVEKGLVIESSIMTVKHTGLETKTYDLALEGILLVLQREMEKPDSDKWNHAFIRKIISRHSYTLPLVFDKWSYFHKMNVGKMALVRLKIIADTYRNDPNSFRKGVGWYRWLDMEEQITRFFYFYRFFPATFAQTWPTEEDQKAWAKMWKQDKTIRSYIVEVIGEDLRRFENVISQGKNILSYLQKD